MNSQLNSASLFLLPKLKEDKSDVQPGRAGIWDVRPAKVYQTIATSLDLEEPGQRPKTVTSIPNIWARALMFETALHNLDYPLRIQMVEQWQGMLAAIALAEVRQFSFRVQLIELEKVKDSDEFARSLYQLLPEPILALYPLKSKPLNQYNPWQELYVFLWEDSPVGISSPSTFVCPSEEGDWTGLPWYREKRLVSPVSFLNDDEKALLWRWLENISVKLPDYKGSEDARSTITSLLEEFRETLGAKPNRPLQLSNNSQYFGESINRGALSLLNSPVKVPSKPSDVRLIPVPEKASAPELLIIDLDLDKHWNELPQTIWVYDNKTLATRNLLQDLREGNIVWKDEQGRRVEWLEAGNLLLPEFYFIDQKGNALRGSLQPTGADRLTYKGKTITPLLPINSKLLEYFTPEDLIKRIKLEMSDNSNAEVKVTLDLPLSGADDGNPPRNYRYARTYLLKQDNALADVPVLEIWPNLKAKDWQEYYAFYYDQEYGEKTFQVEFPKQMPEESREADFRFKEANGSFQINKLKDFPTYILCKDQSAEPKCLGLILLKSPQVFGEINSGSWKVGVDFGTSFTNVYVNRNDTVDRLTLEPLHLQVTESKPETRNRVLVEFFTTDTEQLLGLPLSSVLTTRVSRQKPPQKQRKSPHLDGCIYVPEDSETLKPQENYIKTGLKWSTYETDSKDWTSLFLEHLALQITSLAVKSNIRQIEWFLSYPSAFSIADQNTYADIWRDITVRLQRTTGLDHICPRSDDPDHWRPESVAVAQYFADWENKDLVYSTCIDIGGGTSDISIWENNRLLHQCSIQLAGYHLLTQFLELKPKILEDNFSVQLAEWSRLKGPKFSAKLDVLLRRNSESWLSGKRDQGILLKALQQEGKYSTGKITPIYLGGNGARFLGWLAEGGRFDQNRSINRLFSYMLAKGSGFNDSKSKVETHLSSNLKDEVACGLVLNSNRLDGWNDEDRITDSMVAGEFCRVNNQEIKPYERLPVARNITITEFEIPDSFKQLKVFLNDFNAVLKDPNLQIGIQPFLLTDDDFIEAHRALTASLLKARGKSEEIRVEPPFILALKALLTVLGRKWAAKR